MRHRQCEEKKQKTNYPFLLWLLPLQKISDLPSVTAGFFSLPFAATDIHIIHNFFTLTYASIDKSKYKTHPRYIVIIERF